MVNVSILLDFMVVDVNLDSQEMELIAMVRDFSFQNYSKTGVFHHGM